MIMGTIKASDFLKGKNLEQACFEYLDALRTSGVTNMFGASPYLEAEFNMDKASARKMLAKWMATFGERMERGEVKA